MNKSKIVIIIFFLFLLLGSAIFLLLTNLGWHKQCGGFTGEINQNKCSEIFVCINAGQNPDEFGSCKLKYINF